VCLFGDGALEEGSWHESINIAAMEKLPVIYLCENNSLEALGQKAGEYPSSTLAAVDLIDLVTPFGVPAIQVDGCDAGAVHEAMNEALQRARTGQTVKREARGAAETTQFTDEQIKFFESQVRPLLVEHCFECHSSKAKTVKGGLKLDSREGALKGGDSGAGLVPGEADKSLIIDAVRWKSFEMPPKGKLSTEQVDTLARWVAAGAPWPPAVVAVTAEVVVWPVAADEEVVAGCAAAVVGGVVAWILSGSPGAPGVTDVRHQD
jgi:mono/diheme cytochrome c family protein